MKGYRPTRTPDMRRRALSANWIVLIAGWSLVAAGCGAPTSPYPSARVAGNITLDGQPLPAGNISFIPTEGGQSRPTAIDFHNGAYNLDDAPLGSVRVRIISPQETGKMIPGSSQPEPEIIDIVPAGYRQGIEVEITGDNDKLNFDLTSE